ncbi:MAG: HIT domain-containing protein [Candidatus Omnitrophica bacterium]|nr:HIT domain-containing protein [Candidatus Omnitrophota bacterium]MBU1933321.1 HIT domain-containing protein [Candidatus Omnitrophota bacterium]
MMMFQKAHNLKIVAVILSIVFLCNTSLYSYPVSKDTLRVPSSFKEPDYRTRVQATFAHYQCPICKDTNILYETQHFKILSDFHPLNLGHILVVPKTHTLSMATLDEQQSKELEILTLNLKKILSEFYDCEVIFFEHGSVVSDAERAKQGGNTIVHAHLHIIPVPKGFDILSTLSNQPYITLKPINSFEDLSQQFESETGYFFYETPEGDKYIFELDVTYTAPSQFLRRIVGEALGNGDWDWKIASLELQAKYKRLFEQTTEDLLPLFRQQRVYRHSRDDSITEGSPSKCLETFREQFKDEEVHIGNEADEDERIEASGLIKARGMGRSTVYEELKWLIKMGLVRRVKGKRDYYTLTQRGRELTDKQAKFVCGIEALQGFSIPKGETRATRDKIYHNIQNLSRLKEDTVVFFLEEEVAQNPNAFEEALRKLGSNKYPVILFENEEEKQKFLTEHNDFINRICVDYGIEDRLTFMTYKEAGIENPERIRDLEAENPYLMQILGIDDLHCIPLTPAKLRLHPDLQALKEHLDNA